MVSSIELLRDEERLGRALLDHSIISQQEFDLVRRQARATGIDLWRVLLNLNLVSAETLDSLLSNPDGQSFPTSHRPGSPLSLREDLAEAVDEGDLPGLVEQIFDRAFELRATDIHFDPQDDARLRVRLRIDGQMHDILLIPAEMAQGTISRIKVMGNMNIIERRDSQDGHIVQRFGEFERNLRIATVPTSRGERLVARILDESAVTVGLDKLGMSHEQMESLHHLLREPNGIIIVTGPVGSGKTTTLYSSLQRINVPSLNVMTIEDPVEYRLAGVNQLQVDPRSDWTFPKALRAMLRQDPDVMMIGEIRDDETAKIAVRASLTGDLVLTSMHANDAAGAVGTLYNFGIPGYLLSSSLLGVIAQRLVRKINPEAIEEYPADEKMRALLRLSPDEYPNLMLRRGKGTPADLGTGYLGRTGVFEVMVVDELLRDMIFRETTKDVLRQVAVDLGMMPLQQHAIQKVIQGVTTLEEIFRVGII